MKTKKKSRQHHPGRARHGLTPAERLKAELDDERQKREEEHMRQEREVRDRAFAEWGEDDEPILFDDRDDTHIDQGLEQADNSVDEAQKHHSVISEPEYESETDEEEQEEQRKRAARQMELRKRTKERQEQQRAEEAQQLKEQAAAEAKQRLEAKKHLEKQRLAAENNSEVCYFSDKNFNLTAHRT